MCSARDDEIAGGHDSGAAGNSGAVNRGDRDQPRFGQREQQCARPFPRSRAGRVSRLPQIESGAERFAGAAQNQNALFRIGGGIFDRSSQLGHQFNREGVAALGPIEREQGDLRRLFFDENDWHDLTLSCQ